MLTAIAVKQWKSENSSGLPNLRSGVTTDFDRYKKFENLCAKPLHTSARHIGFVIYFKIAQTCILRYYSTYCKK